MIKNNFWKSKKVFVTGAGGFIGSHLVEGLLSRGAIVTALVHYNSRNDWGLLEQIDVNGNQNLNVVIGDIRDQYALRKFICNQEYIFHLAALIGIPYSYVSPNEYISTNIQGTANVLQIANEFDVKKIIHTSTSEVYGTACYMPIDENHPLQGQSPYSASKIAADMIAQSYSYSFKLPVVIMRPFNTFGPRQSARAVIPTIIQQALYSDKIELGSLDTKRDFNYVEDTVRAFLAVAESDYRNAEVFNCATGKQITIGDLLELVLSILNKEMPVAMDDQRIRPKNSEVMSLIGDATKLIDNTHWEREYTLELGIEETINYIKRNSNQYKKKGYII
jgi:NAD dependent epimerase/dehydratase